MIVGIIWAFEYSGELPAVFHDIYYASKYLSKICDRIHIISDLKSDQETASLAPLINQGLIDTDAYGIIEQYRTDGVLQPIGQPLQQLTKILLEDQPNRIVFYFSGHSKDRCLIFPEVRISFQNILAILTQLTGDTTQILIIIDACYVGDFGLPYMMNQRRIYQIINTFFPQQEIIGLTSSSSTQRSGMIHTGSIFTRLLFQILSENGRNIRQSVDKITSLCSQRNQQEANVYSSKPNLNTLWPWVYGSKFEVFTQKEIIIKTSC